MSYNLRSGDPHKSETASSSPQRNRSPENSCSTSPRVRGNKSSFSADDNDDDSSQLADDIDLSSPSTTASPTAETPSPPNRHIDYKTPPCSMYPDLSDISVSEEKTTSKDEKKNEDKLNIRVIWVGSLVLVVVCIMLNLCWTEKSPDKVPARLPRFKTFVADVDLLQNEFRSQDRRTWKTIKSSVKHILKSTDEAQYPAVVVFAVNSKYISVASCLARRVASLFNSQRDIPTEDGYLDVTPFSDLTPKEQKKKLEAKIALNFQIGYSVVIDQLSALSPTASLLLHGTCDDSNAPFKDVFISIVFGVDRDLTSFEVDSELQKYFEKELDADKIGALLSRINNNPVVVNNEDLSSINCPA